MGIVSQEIVNAYIKSFNDWYVRGDYQNSGLVSFKLLNLLKNEKLGKMPDGIADVAEKELKIARSHLDLEGAPLVGDKHPSYDDGKSSFRRLGWYIHNLRIKLRPEAEQQRIDLIHKLQEKGEKGFLRPWDQHEPYSARDNWPRFYRPSK